MLKITTSILCITLLCACNDTKEEKDISIDDVDKVESDTITSEANEKPELVEIKTWLIENDGCELVLLGESIPELGEDYNVEFVTETRMEEGEEYNISMAIISEGNERLLECELAGEGTDAAVYGIHIYSDRFKTAEGIGVGSTREEFVDTYPDYTLWYTYVGGFTTFDTPKYSALQFQMNMDDYLPELEFSSDMEMLSPDDFKEAARINKIRFY